jgi:hypothetical protein
VADQLRHHGPLAQAAEREGRFHAHAGIRVCEQAHQDRRGRPLAHASHGHGRADAHHRVGVLRRALHQAGVERAPVFRGQQLGQVAQRRAVLGGQRHRHQRQR